MKKIVVGVAAACVLGTIAPAVAADLGVVPADNALVETIPSATFDWTGFYAGINGGYTWGRADSQSVGGFDLKGGVFGGQIGYNQDLGGFVLGAEADIQWTGLSGGTTAVFGTRVDGRLEYFGTVRGRAGVALDRLMPYVTGGFAYGHANAQSSFGPGYSTDRMMTGWAAGVGAEYALTDQISIKAEYLRTDFGSETLFSGTPIQEDVPTAFNTIRAGVNFRF